MSHALPATATVALVLLGVTGQAATFAALPLALLVLWLGIALPFRRIGRRNDFSYGIYIYAYPVQQLLALVSSQRLGVPAFIALSLVGTVPLAMLSWFLVERPALRLKGVVPPWLRVRRGQAAAPRPSET
jgi:peptidoglycan/LPS O-acetylase OafA/YrhL